MSNSNIVLFDAYGTLFKLKSNNAELDKILGKNNEEFITLWRTKLLEYTWLTSLMEDWEDFNEINKKAIQFTCKKLKLDEYSMTTILLDIYNSPILYKDTRVLLEQLSNSKHVISIVSNGSQKTLKNAVIENGISDLIDKIFTADQVHKFKVSPFLYRMATSFYNVGPSKIYFISSNAWDITGAQYFGYKTIWINRNQEVFDTLIDGPDYEVSNLEEIKAIIIQKDS